MTIGNRLIKEKIMKYDGIINQEIKDNAKEILTLPDNGVKQELFVSKPLTKFKQH